MAGCGSRGAITAAVVYCSLWNSLHRNSHLSTGGACSGRFGGLFWVISLQTGDQAGNCASVRAGMGLFELGIQVLMGAVTELHAETQRSAYGELREIEICPQMYENLVGRIHSKLWRRMLMN